jgi:hypothetical protein
MAGLRTNALVAAGAAMFVMMLGLIAGERSQGRVAAYVVSGIGFLGGGVILKDGPSIRGLNTAATPLVHGGNRNLAPDGGDAVRSGGDSGSDRRKHPAVTGGKGDQSGHDRQRC